MIFSVFSVAYWIGTKIQISWKIAVEGSDSMKRGFTFNCMRRKFFQKTDQIPFLANMMSNVGQQPPKSWFMSKTPLEVLSSAMLISTVCAEKINLQYFISSKRPTPHESSCPKYLLAYLNDQNQQLLKCPNKIPILFNL